MNKAIYQSVLVIAGGLMIGWGLADASASHAQSSRFTDATTYDRAKISRSDPSSAWNHRTASWAPREYNANQLAGFHQLDHSPMIRLFGMASCAALDADAINALARWEGLDIAQTETLKRIIEEAKERQLAWEKREIKAEPIRPGGVRLFWKSTPAELHQAFQSDLTRAFGEETAQSLWQKGDLENFADFCGTAAAEQSVDLAVTTTEGHQGMVFDVECSSARKRTRLSMYLDPNQPQLSLPFRTDHLVDLIELSRELRDTRPGMDPSGK